MPGGNTAVVHGATGGQNEKIPDGPLMAPGALASRILSVPKRSVLSVSGTSAAAIRDELDRIETCEQRVLFLELPQAGTAEAIIDEVISVLAEIALGLWPNWFGISLAGTGASKNGLQSPAKAIQEMAPAIPGLLLPWALKAAQRAAAGLAPRVRKTSPATELAQLSMAINPAGLILLIHCDAARAGGCHPAVSVHALEWIAEHGGAAVTALFSQMPHFEPPFDRILYGALRAEAASATPADIPAKAAKAEVRIAEEPRSPEEPWIAPWRGKPHPLSDVEKRLFDALGNDPELTALFTFNTMIETVQGSKPKVDLVWQGGKLIVEIDGTSHNSRTAFIGDRQRDYELLLSGYTVLRLVNEEVQQDLALAIEKIRGITRIQNRRHKRNL